MRSKNAPTNTLAKYLSWWFGLVFVLLPFHAFFTTWGGSNFGHLDAWRIWKELALIVSLPFVVVLVWRETKLRKWLLRDWLTGLIVLYVLLFAIKGAWALHHNQTNSSALIYSLLSNLRFLGFMLMVMAVVAVHDFLSNQWLKLLLGPAIIVIIFGLLQRYVLSYDFLRHFGYGPDTIPAYQTVDQKLEYRRIQSSLRGANPLGAYMVLVITAVVGQLWRHRFRTLLVGILLGALVVLGFTYSRSAWLAVLPSAGLVLWWQHNNTHFRRRVIVALSIISLVLFGGLVLGRNDSVLQNTFFHTDRSSLSSQSSNAGRVSALEGALKEVEHEPLGRGPGTAGPASFRNQPHQPRIAENYYLQIAQETGWVGLTLFLVINGLVVYRLWKRRYATLAQILLASWVGLALVNLISHAWADDTLGLLWWGLAGIALAPVLTAATQKTARKRS